MVPDEVDLGAAAAVPVAGVTALRALRRLGFLTGRRVLITGASGGVGGYAVQLAASAGAHVIASVGSAARGEGLVMFALVGGPFRAENGCGCPLTPLLYGPFEVVV
ncbi:MAG TPA: hypothetical protein VFE39_11400 [Pseudonocardia sp.]|nr:hypothetical protein [Pseudonocardia sp.]